MKKITILSSLLLVLISGLYAQTGKFYGLRESSKRMILCKIDTATKKLTDVDSLPSIYSPSMGQGVSSCDQEHGRYFFLGFNSIGRDFLALDVNTGKILTKTIIPKWAAGIEPAYDKVTSKIYGIIPNQDHTWFVSLDTLHDSIIKIDSIPGNASMGQGIYGIDSKHGRYYFLGGDRLGNSGIFIINISDGSIYKIIQLVKPYTLNDVQYDEKQERFYGIHQDAATGARNYLAYLDANNKMVIIDSIKGSGGVGQGISCYDAAHSRYFYHDGRIQTTDVKNANILNTVSIKGTGLVDFQYFGTTTPNPANILKGEMAISTGKALKYSKMYLCTYSANDSNVKVIDSIVTDSGGHYSFSVHDTTVYLLAFPNPALYPNELPTWADASTDFTYSNRIFIKSGTNIKHYKTIYGSNPGGSGFVGGKIVYCYACKTYGSGKSANGVRVILADSNGKAQAYTYTDANGNFKFSNIAIDKYKIVVDLPNMNNSIAPVLSLTTAAPNLNSLSFTLFPTYLYLDRASGIEQSISRDNEYYASPNPFTNNLNLSSHIKVAGKINISIVDLTGREVYQNILTLPSGDTNISLNNLTFKTGIYFAKIQSGNEEKVLKLVKSE